MCFCSRHTSSTRITPSLYSFLLLYYNLTNSDSSIVYYSVINTLLIMKKDHHHHTSGSAVARTVSFCLFAQKRQVFRLAYACPVSSGLRISSAFIDMELHFDIDQSRSLRCSCDVVTRLSCFISCMRSVGDALNNATTTMFFPTAKPYQLRSIPFNATPSAAHE